MTKHIMPLLIALLVFTGCASSRIHRISQADYPPVQNPAEVRLFVGELRVPHEEVAWVDSFVANDRTSQVRRSQLADLRTQAAKIGANAVVEVQLLEELHRGMVPDPTTPFRTWQQGEYELYFIRGKAIRLSEETTGDDLMQQPTVTSGEPALVPENPTPPIRQPAPDEDAPIEVQPPRPGY